MAAKATEELLLFDKLRKEVKVPAPLRLTPEITLECPTKSVMDLASAATDENGTLRILMGDQYEAVVELFAGESPHMWKEFNEVYLEHFFDVPRAAKS